MTLTTATPHVGMIVTSIGIDASGFYTDQTDTQIIVDTPDDNTIVTISMKQPDGVNHPITYVSHETSIDGQAHRLIFDQNNSLDLTFKAIDSKPELLTYKGFQQALLAQYVDLAQSFQLTPNELKLLNSLHETIMRRFSVKFVPPTIETTVPKAPKKKSDTESTTKASE